MEHTQRWFAGKRLKEEPWRTLGGACACLGASLKFKQTRLISCTWRGKSKEKSSQCSEICRRSHFCGVQASARIIWSIWHVHARYCTLCHVIPRALYSAACFAFVIPTAGRAMLRLEAPRRAQSCFGFSVPKTGIDPPFFWRQRLSPDRHWQYIFTSINVFKHL